MLFLHYIVDNKYILPLVFNDCWKKNYIVDNKYFLNQKPSAKASTKAEYFSFSDNYGGGKLAMLAPLVFNDC